MSRDPEAKTALLDLLEEKDRRTRHRRLEGYYPPEGPLSREHYPKHLAFFAAGRTFTERLVLGGNRSGKSHLATFEATLHATGRYPDWWKGRRFTHPVRAWACGDSGKTLREVLQEKFLGSLLDVGTGMIPQEAILRVTRQTGVSDAVDTIHVRHISGGVSTITFKSYDQRREAFYGAEVHVILLDEEPPEDIHVECVMRTMTCRGIVLLTFTPLLGMSDVVLRFVPNGDWQDIADDGNATPDVPSRWRILMGWEDAPHLSPEQREEAYRTLPPYQREARSKGIPALGSGAIYPVPETDILVDPFTLPPAWPRAYGLDVGWNRTAAVWGALDPQTSILYLYSEHYRGEAEPVVHATAIRGRGAWIEGAIDPAARGRSQHDGRRLLTLYREAPCSLRLHPADNAVEAGLYAVWSRLSTGKLKVFASLAHWRGEYRLYARDEKGRVIKRNDHLMDATRYLVQSGFQHARREPETTPPATRPLYYGSGSSDLWM